MSHAVAKGCEQQLDLATDGDEIISMMPPVVLHSHSGSLGRKKLVMSKCLAFKASYRRVQRKIICGHLFKTLSAVAKNIFLSNLSLII